MMMPSFRPFFVCVCVCVCVFDEKRALNNTIINKIGDWTMSFDEFVFSFFRLFFFIFKKRRVVARQNHHTNRKEEEEEDKI